MLIDLNLNLLNPNLLINKIKLAVMRGRVKIKNYIKKKTHPLTKKLNQNIHSINQKIHSIKSKNIFNKIKKYIQ